jgi:hypothetical protein
MQRRRLGAAVDRANADQDIVRASFGVFDKHVEIAVVVEDARVEQLVLRVVLAAAGVLGHQIGIGVDSLRVLVEHPHPRVRGRRVQVKVVFFDILTMVAFGAGQPKQALL